MQVCVGRQILQRHIPAVRTPDRWGRILHLTARTPAGASVLRCGCCFECGKREVISSEPGGQRLHFRAVPRQIRSASDGPPSFAPHLGCSRLKRCRLAPRFQGGKGMRLGRIDRTDPISGSHGGRRKQRRAHEVSEIVHVFLWVHPHAAPKQHRLPEHEQEQTPDCGKDGPPIRKPPIKQRQPQESPPEDPGTDAAEPASLLLQD